MKTPIKTLSLCASILALATTAQAGVSFSSTPTGTAWDGTPTHTTVANASFSTLNVGQGDATITGSYGLMAETFTPTSAFTLGSFNLVMAVNTADNYQLHLYDLGPAGTISVNASASYTPAGPDLFSGLAIALSPTGGTVQGQFALSGADQVSLLANRQYALEIWTPAASGASGLLWFRGSAVDAGGQMFSGGDSAGLRQTLNLNGQAGGTPRTAGVAFYAASVVPEPSSLALVGLGALSLMARRRK